MDQRERFSRQQAIKAHKLHAAYDSKALTRNARAAFFHSFELKVDPEGTLPAEERLRRARHLQRAHMKNMALRSAEARAAKAGGS